MLMEAIFFTFLLCQKVMYNRGHVLEKYTSKCKTAEILNAVVEDFTQKCANDRFITLIDLVILFRQQMILLHIMYRQLT